MLFPSGGLCARSPVTGRAPRSGPPRWGRSCRRASRCSSRFVRWQRRALPRRIAAWQRSTRSALRAGAPRPPAEDEKDPGPADPARAARALRPALHHPQQRSVTVSFVFFSTRISLIVGLVLADRARVRGRLLHERAPRPPEAQGGHADATTWVVAVAGRRPGRPLQNDARIATPSAIRSGVSKLKARRAEA